MNCSFVHVIAVCLYWQTKTCDEKHYEIKQEIEFAGIEEKMPAMSQEPKTLDLTILIM